MKSLSAHMQPMVIQALVTAFQRSLREELRAAFDTETECQGRSARDGVSENPGPA